MSGERLLPLNEVKKRTTYSTAHIYNMMNSGDFPLSVKIGPWRVAWLESEVDAWIRSRAENHRRASRRREAAA